MRRLRYLAGILAVTSSIVVLNSFPIIILRIYSAESYSISNEKVYVEESEGSLGIPKDFAENRSNKTPHDFAYLHNPVDFCQHDYKHDRPRRIKYLFAVGSSVAEFSRRKIIRRTWASMSKARISEIGVLFFLGDDGEPATNPRLSLEAQKYGDIVQESYQDTYRNLSLKSQGQLKWISTYCKDADFLIHVDDDVFPDVNNVVEEIANTKNGMNSDISCAKVFRPIVRRDGKWKTSYDEYSKSQYPLSCVGWCFVIPYDLASRLYRISLDTKMLHLEDVWVTGILRIKADSAQVRKMRGGEALCRHLGWPKDGTSVNEKLLKSWAAYRLRLA